MTPTVEVRDDRSDDGDDAAEGSPGAEPPLLEPDLLDTLGGILASVLAAEGVPGRASAGLTLVSSDAIATLKAEHLGGDGPTDVLSFPLDGTGPVPEGEPWLVGDVVLCPSVAAAQAPSHAGTLQDELALLVVHGGLHLCGWDHDGPEDQAAMWARERELLTGLGRTPARDPWGPS
ncbi:MAG: rRNA maturation RNase YbeY [Microthrixaceae bacterium]